MSNIRLEKVFKALANRRRLSIIKFLSQRGVANVSEIADHIGISIKATSKHLIKMSSVGIVGRNQKTKYMLYFVKTDPIQIIKKL